MKEARVHDAGDTGSRYLIKTLGGRDQTSCVFCTFFLVKGGEIANTSAAMEPINVE